VIETLALIQPMLALLQGSTEGFRYIGTGVAAGTAVIGSGIGMGYLIGTTIASIHRQPEAFDQTRTLMFLGIGLVEAQALFGLVFALLVAFVL
jgi:F-type H+-transporting ATPase subunit c